MNAAVGVDRGEVHGGGFAIAAGFRFFQQATEGVEDLGSQHGWAMLAGMESADAITLTERVLGRFAASVEHASSPFILGISGLQGSGKSTLAAALIEAAREKGWSAVTLSLDDVYLTRAERETLGRQVHPLLRTRGVPGTHDLALLASTLDALDKAAPERPVSIPRFDKGQDERYASTLWPEVPQPP